MNNTEVLLDLPNKNYSPFTIHCDDKSHIWPVGQAVKSPPSQGGIMGSIPVRVTKIKIQ